MNGKGGVRSLIPPFASASNGGRSLWRAPGNVILFGNVVWVSPTAGHDWIEVVAGCLWPHMRIRREFRSFWWLRWRACRPTRGGFEAPDLTIRCCCEEEPMGNGRDANLAGRYYLTVSRCWQEPR